MLSAKPKSGITSWEKPSETSPVDSLFAVLLPWYLEEGPKVIPQQLCLSPTSTPYDQITLELALLSGMELVPLFPVSHMRRPSLGGHCC